jgi:hypothetical protein
MNTWQKNCYKNWQRIKYKNWDFAYWIVWWIECLLIFINGGYYNSYSTYLIFILFVSILSLFYMEEEGERLYG